MSSTSLTFSSASEKLAGLSWKSPAIMLLARSGFCILAQLLVTLIFVSLRNPDPLKAGAVWWQVSGTLIDLGCLALLVYFTRREGLRLVDLIGFNKKKLKKDILLGIGFFVIGFPVLMMGGAILSSLIVFGSMQPTLPPELMSKPLPLWAAVYARLIWWPIWSVTEELTYNGYALPRLRALFRGRAWLAVIPVTLAWSVQHAFLPFLPDGKIFLYLFLQMIPLTLGTQIAVLTTRRLPPFILAHWGMDLFSAVAMITIV